MLEGCFRLLHLDLIKPYDAEDRTRRRGAVVSLQSYDDSL